MNKSVPATTTHGLEATPESEVTLQEAHRALMGVLIGADALNPAGSVDPQRAREIAQQLCGDLGEVGDESWAKAAELLKALPSADIFSLGILLETELSRLADKKTRTSEYLRLEQRRRAVFTTLLENLGCDFSIPYASSFLAHYCIQEYFEEGEVVDYDQLRQRVERSLDALVDTSQANFLDKLKAAIANYLESKELKPAERALAAEYAVRDIEMIALVGDWVNIRAAMTKVVEAQANDTFTTADIPALIPALREAAQAVSTQKLDLEATNFKQDLTELEELFAAHLAQGPMSKEEAATIINDGQFYMYELNIGNPGLYGQYPSEAMFQAVVADITKCSGYEHHAGAERVKELAAEFYNLYFQNQNANMPERAITPREIVVGNGASEVIQIFLEALVENGENAIGTSPIYPLYSSIMGKMGEELKTITLDVTEEGGVKKWKFDVEGLAALIDFNTKVLCINSPNNPTGAIFSRESLEAILDLAEEYGLFVISDEIYCEDLYDEQAQSEFCSMGSLAYERGVPTVVISGISKGLGKAAGWRCGWGVFIDRDHKADKVFDAANTVAKARLCPNTLGQRGAIPVLKDLVDYEQRIAGNLEAGSAEPIDRSDLDTLAHLDHLKELTGQQKDAMYEAFNQGPLSMPKPDGAYYGFFQVEGIDNFEDEKRFARELLIQKRVHLVPGQGFEFPRPGWFRVVFLDTAERIKESGQIVKEFAEGF